MTKKYFPLLVAKAGELAALSHLSQEIKNEICPIIQVLELDYSKLNAFLDGWNFEGNEIYLDFSILKSESSRNFETFFQRINQRGVNFKPVINFSDRADYVQCVRNLLSKNIITDCVIRCKNLTIEEPKNQIIRDFNIRNNQLSVIIDCGYITNTSLSFNLERSINNITNVDSLKQIIIASGSFPVDLGAIEPNKTTHLTRHEWDLWNLINKHITISTPLYYSDYGTKHPIHIETSFSGSCSVKYSTNNNFVIFRGTKSTNSPLGNNQYIVHSKALVKSKFYSGAGFSWADARILHYSSLDQNNPSSNPGSPTIWVEISQNHHFTLLTRLL